MTVVFLTNASRPFHRQDILDAICFPHGSVITFAYGRSWIHDSASNARQLIGRDALIVFYEPQVALITGDYIDLSLYHNDNNCYQDFLKRNIRDNESHLFIPIRFAQIDSLNRVGTATVYNLRLTDWVDYKEDSSSWPTTAQSCTGKLKRITEWNTALPTPQEYLFGTDEHSRKKLVYFDSNGIATLSELRAERHNKHEDVAHHSSWLNMARYLTQSVRSFSNVTLMCPHSGRGPIDPVHFIKRPRGHRIQTLVNAKPVKAVKSRMRERREKSKTSPKLGKANPIPLIKVKAGSRHVLHALLVHNHSIVPHEPLVQIDGPGATSSHMRYKQQGIGTNAVLSIAFAESAICQFIPIAMTAKTPLEVGDTDPLTEVSDSQDCGPLSSDDLPSIPIPTQDGQYKRIVSKSRVAEQIRSPIVSPKFVVLAQINPPLIQFFIALAIIATGLALLTVSPDTLKRLVFPANSLDTWQARLLVIVRVLGSLCLILGGLMGLRRGLNRAPGL